MSTTTNLTQLKINYLSQAQYDDALANNLINDNELYFISLDEGQETGYLLLAGGNVTGPVHFGDSVTIDELTVGNLVVNGSLSADTIDAGLFSGGPVSYTTISGNFNTTIYLVKRNGIVTIFCFPGNATPLTKGAWNTICTIPEAYRPYVDTCRFLALDNNTSTAAKLPLEGLINSNGDLRIFGNADSVDNNQIYFTLSYIGPEGSSDDSEAYIDIPNYQTSGSEDKALYDAITALNWQSNVIE